MAESMAEMMARLEAGLPSKHWISTSVGVVNTKNHAAVMRAGKRLKDMRRRKAQAAAEAKNG